jgi:PASTA domain
VSAQTISCSAVAPEVRDSVRAAGACSDGPSTTARQRRAVEPAARDTANRRNEAARRSAGKRSDASTRTALSVPNVVGETFDAARKQLQRFEVDRVERPSDAPADEVIGQFPIASATAAPGSRVYVVVSSGPQLVQLPNVIDRSYQDAAAALSAFKIDRVEVPSASASGQVVAQQPAAGALVRPGSTVTVNVSAGSPAAAAAPTPAATPLSVAPAPTDRVRTLQNETLLAVVASLLSGIAVGALTMRYWLLRRRPRAAMDEPPTAISSETEALREAPEPTSAVRFFARLDTGTITVEFPSPRYEEEPVKQYAGGPDE